MIWLAVAADYLTNGERIEVAQRMAGHANAKTTGLYDRRNDAISVGEVERIGI
jgi:site-specific recombinase XerD